MKAKSYETGISNKPICRKCLNIKVIALHWFNFPIILTNRNDKILYVNFIYHANTYEFFGSSGPVQRCFDRDLVVQRTSVLTQFQPGRGVSALEHVPGNNDKLF